MMGWFLAQVVIVSALAWSAAVVAAEEIDLSEVDRSIPKEAAWASGEPLYCLFVISAERRVWFVMDGDDLYMDVNENGDLTDSEDKLPRFDLSFEKRREIRNFSHWRIPDITGADGKPMITNIQISKPRDWNSPGSVYFDIPVYGQVLTRPIFSDRPADAPILHPTGPHRLSLEVRVPNPKWFRADVSNHFHVDGHIFVDGLGEDTRFVLEALNLDCRVEFPLNDGSTKAKEFRLKNYITGPMQTSTVIIPEGVDEDGTVKITLSKRPEATGPAVDPVVVDKPLAELRAVRREEK